MFTPFATESAPETTLPASAPTPSPRRSAVCVPVVDDDPLSRALQARRAGLLGYRARVAGDALALTQSLKVLTTSAESMAASGLTARCDSLRTAALVQRLADEHPSVLTVLLRAARDGAGTPR